MNVWATLCGCSFCFLAIETWLRIRSICKAIIDLEDGAENLNGLELKFSDTSFISVYVGKCAYSTQCELFCYRLLIQTRVMLVSLAIKSRITRDKISLSSQPNSFSVESKRKFIAPSNLKRTYAFFNATYILGEKCLGDKERMLVLCKESSLYGLALLSDPPSSSPPRVESFIWSYPSTWSASLNRTFSTSELGAIRRAATCMRTSFYP